MDLFMGLVKKALGVGTSTKMKTLGGIIVLLGGIFVYAISRDGNEPEALIEGVSTPELPSNETINEIPFEIVDVEEETVTE